MDLRVCLWGGPSYFSCGSDKQFIPLSICDIFLNANSPRPPFVFHVQNVILQCRARKGKGFGFVAHSLYSAVFGALNVVTSQSLETNRITRLGEAWKVLLFTTDVMTVKCLVFGQTFPEWRLSLIKVTLCDRYSPSLSRESFQVLDINIFLKYLPLIQSLFILLAQY